MGNNWVGQSILIEWVCIIEWEWILIMQDCGRGLDMVGGGVSRAVVY